MLGAITVSPHYNLDGEKLWDLYIQLHSLEKVVTNLADQGIINEKTGRPYKSYVLNRVIWKWVTSNPDKALERMKEKYPDVSYAYWEQFLVAKAYTVFVTIKHSRRSFENWIKEHNLEKYVDYRKSPYFD
jgi:hypothetical protein